MNKIYDTYINKLNVRKTIFQKKFISNEKYINLFKRRGAFKFSIWNKDSKNLRNFYIN